MLPAFQGISGATSTTWRSGRALRSNDICGVIFKPKVDHENTKGIKHEKKVKFRVFVVFFARFHFLSNPFAALRAIFKIRIERLATAPAFSGRIGLRLRIIRTQALAGLRAAVAHNKRLALFDSEYGDEKQAQIVIHALRIGLI